MGDLSVVEVKRAKPWKMSQREEEDEDWEAPNYYSQDYVESAP